MKRILIKAAERKYWKLTVYLLNNSYDIGFHRQDDISECFPFVYGNLIDQPSGYFFKEEKVFHSRCRPTQKEIDHFVQAVFGKYDNDDTTAVIGYSLHKITSRKFRMFGKRQTIEDSKRVGPFTVTYKTTRMSLADMYPFIEEFSKTQTESFDFGDKSRGWNRGYGEFIRFFEEIKKVQNAEIDYQVLQAGHSVFFLCYENNIVTKTREL